MELEDMIRKINKDIQRLEQLKQKKTALKEELEKELNEINAKLKQLYAFKSQYEKMESSVDDFFESYNENKVTETQ